MAYREGMWHVGRGCGVQGGVVCRRGHGIQGGGVVYRKEVWHAGRG